MSHQVVVDLGKKVDPFLPSKTWLANFFVRYDKIRDISEV